MSDQLFSKENSKSKAKENAKSKVATETATKDNMALVAGETTTQAKTDSDKIEENPWSPWEDVKIEENPWSPWEDVDDETGDASSSRDNPYLHEGGRADAVGRADAEAGPRPTSRVAGRMPTSRKRSIPIIEEPGIVKPRGSVAPYLGDVVRPPFFKKL